MSDKTKFYLVFFVSTVLLIYVEYFDVETSAETQEIEYKCETGQKKTDGMSAAHMTDNCAEPVRE